MTNDTSRKRICSAPLNDGTTRYCRKSAVRIVVVRAKTGNPVDDFGAELAFCAKHLHEYYANREAAANDLVLIDKGREALATCA